MAKSSAEDRYYPNEFEDYIPENNRNIEIKNNEPGLSSEFSSYVKKAVLKLISQIELNVAQALSYGDKIYTGTAGIALLYLLYPKPSGTIIKARSGIIHRAKTEILKAAEKLSRVNDRISFLNGDVGIITLAAVIHSVEGDQSKAIFCTKKIISYSKYVVSSDSSVPDELLYGRAGYLYALLLVRKYISNDAVPDSLVREVTKAIITSGRRLSSSRHSISQKVPPLQFEWHGKEYLGAAHGYCGILSTLLLTYKENLISLSDVDTFVKPTIDYILGMQYPSKNIPSSVGSKSYDVLVQWCHGAPGAVHMVALAYELFGDKKYLDAAIDFGEVTWNRGLLTKGYSLCHGVAGNGHVFLKLYQITKDVKYLHRATKFAEWCFCYGTKQVFVPDRPFSLFEGVAGVVYFLLDVLQPKEAKFPGVELI